MTAAADILLIAKPGTGYVAVQNNGRNGRSNKVFAFLQDCRKREITQSVSFGTETYGMSGTTAIDARDVIAFQDRAAADGLMASFA